MALAGAAEAQPAWPAWTAGAVFSVRGPIVRPATFSGVGASRLLVTRNAVALRADASLLAGNHEDVTYGCTEGECDTRGLAGIATAGISAMFRLSDASSASRVYAVFGAGGFATRYAGGYYSPPPGSSQPAMRGTGFGPSGGLLQAGLGFVASSDRVGWQLEVRVHQYRESIDERATGVSAMVGLVW